MTVSLTLIRLMAFCLWAWNMKWKNFWCLVQCPKYKQSHTKKNCGSEISHKIGQKFGLWTTWKGIKGKSFLFWKVCLDYEHCSLKIFLQGIWQLSLWNQPPRNCATLYVSDVSNTILSNIDRTRTCSLIISRTSNEHQTFSLFWWFLIFKNHQSGLSLMSVILLYYFSSF